MGQGGGGDAAGIANSIISGVGGIIRQAQQAKMQKRQMEMQKEMMETKMLAQFLQSMNAGPQGGGMPGGGGGMPPMMG